MKNCGATSGDLECSRDEGHGDSRHLDEYKGQEFGPEDED